MNLRSLVATTLLLSVVAVAFVLLYQLSDATDPAPDNTWMFILLMAP